MLAFCVNTFSWGDYVGEVWDQWLADPNGHLLVAELEGLPVAIQYVYFPGEGEAYLQGMRVDPAVRGRGIATAMLEAGLALARQRGARVVRLLTKPDNEATHRMMEAASFRHAIAFTDLRAAPDAEVAPSPEAGVPGDLLDLWQLIEGSEHFHRSDCTYVVDWHVRELTKARLAQHLAAGEVYVLRRSGRPAAMAHVRWTPDNESLWIGGLFGEPEALRELALQLRVLAARVAAPEVVAFVPKVEPIVSSLAGAGYVVPAGGEMAAMDLYIKDLGGR